MKYTEGDSPIIVKGGVRGTTFPEGSAFFARLW